MKNTERVKELIAELKANAETDVELHHINFLTRALFDPPAVEIVDEKHQTFNGMTYHTTRPNQHFIYTQSLHRAVWEYYYGEIPPGYVIHHIDENKSNNNIENLIMLSVKDHQTLHNYLQFLRTEPVEKPPKPVKSVICKNCGQMFTPESYQRRVFCCDACRREYFHTKEKIFTRTCPICNKIFQTRTERSLCCSLDCARELAAGLPRIPRSVVYPKKVCPVCGTVFDLIDKRQQTCSKKCGHLLSAKKHCKKSTYKDIWTSTAVTASTTTT